MSHSGHGMRAIEAKARCSRSAYPCPCSCASFHQCLCSFASGRSRLGRLPLALACLAAPHMRTHTCSSPPPRVQKPFGNQALSFLWIPPWPLASLSAAIRPRALRACACAAPAVRIRRVNTPLAHTNPSSTCEFARAHLKDAHDVLTGCVLGMAPHQGKALPSTSFLQFRWMMRVVPYHGISFHKEHCLWDQDTQILFIGRVWAQRGKSEQESKFAHAPDTET